MGPRIPKLNDKGLKYWKNKGKYGKDVMVYFHDDMDGIFSAVVVKERLLNLGYNIKGFGVLNYQEGWTLTTLDPKMINVVVDFANMPDYKRKDLIDIYIDHHGEFTEEEKEYYKDDPVIKTKTASAYEGICRVIGKPLDRTLLYTIDMVDSAKYDDYNALIQDVATSTRLEPALLHAVIQTESAYNPKARSPKGAVGLMQLMPATARRFGVTDRTDATSNVYGGARYLRHLLNLFNNNLRLALASYNAGENAVKRYGNKIPPYRETKNYVKKVMRLYRAHQN